MTDYMTVLYVELSIWILLWLDYNIPPHNSIYFNDSYSTNTELIHNKFKSFHLYFFGDLNCRIGTP